MKTILMALAVAAALPAPDRSTPPKPGPLPRFEVPLPERFTLSNGLPVLWIERHEVPMLDAVLVVRAGAASDPAASPGLASLTAAMLTEGAGGQDALELADAIDVLGARLTSRADWDAARVTLHVPVVRLAPALALMADVALRPGFLEAEWSRFRERRRTAFVEDRDDPQTLGRLAAARAVYGPEHRYGIALEGTPASLERAALADLRAFHGAHYRPEGAFLVIVGDVSRPTLTPLLERHFGNWKAAGPPPSPPRIAAAPKPKRREILLVDKPGAAQSVLIATAAAPASLRPLDAPDMVMNTLLGGSFSSRLNTNLREEHGYSYGARSGFDLREQGGTFSASSSVATDVTAPALRELMRELERIRGTAETPEVERARSYLALSFPPEFETGAGVAAWWAWAERRGITAAEARGYMLAASAVDGAALGAAARRDVDPERMRLVVVGDRSKVEASLRDLGLGSVRVSTVEDLLGPAPPVAGGAKGS